jgi:hypothetical protein
MRALIIVILKPLIQILLKLFDRAVEFTAEGLPKEFVEDSTVEPFHKAVCPRRGNLRFSVLNIIELNKDLIGVDHGAPTVLSAIVGQNTFYPKRMPLVERQHPVIENIHSGLRQFGGVELAEGKGPKGVYHRLEINPANPLEGTHEKGILAEEVSWIGALYLPFSKAGVGFLQKLDLLLGELHVLAVLLLLEAKEPFVASLHVFLEPDIAHRAGAH